MSNAGRRTGRYRAYHGRRAEREDMTMTTQQSSNPGADSLARAARLGV